MNGHGQSITDPHRIFQFFALNFQYCLLLDYHIKNEGQVRNFRRESATNCIYIFYMRGCKFTGTRIDGKGIFKEHSTLIERYKDISLGSNRI